MRYVLAFLLLVGALYFGDVLADRVTCQAAAPTRQPGSAPGGVLMTMTPPPGGSTPTPPPLTLPQPQKPGTNALRGFLAGNGPWWLCLVVPLLALVALAAVLYGKRILDIWVDTKARKASDLRIKREADEREVIRSKAKDEHDLFQIRNQFRHANAQHTDEEILDLELSTGRKHEPIGEYGSKVLAILLNPVFKNGFTRNDVRAAASLHGVPTRFTEVYLMKIRWTSENNKPMLVFNGRSYLCLPANRDNWNWHSRPRWVIQEVDPTLFKPGPMLFHPTLRPFNGEEIQSAYTEISARQTANDVEETQEDTE